MRKIKLLIMLSLALILAISGYKLVNVNADYSLPVVQKNYTSNPPHYIFSIGGEEKNKQESMGGLLKGPMAVTSSPEGKIYVADSGNALIRVFSADGGYLSTFGKGTLNYPLGISYINSKIYVADPNLMTVALFDEDGKELKPLFSKQRLTRSQGRLGEMIRPSGVQQGLDGKLYITDIANHCLVVYNPEGEFLRSIGGEGSGDGYFKYPNALWITGDGKIFVSDSNNRRIQIFDEQGQFIYKMNGSFGATGAFSLPRGITVSDEGIIILVDVFSHKVRAFDEAGFELWSFGGLGIDSEKFNFPNGVYLDSLKARLYVTDRENNRVQVFAFKNN